MSLVGLVDDIWSEFVLSGEENTWRKGGDAGKFCKFGGAVGKLSKNLWNFGLKGLAVTNSDWDGGDWKSGGSKLINDHFNKRDDNCGNNMSCNILVIKLQNLMFPFTIRWRWSL